MNHLKTYQIFENQTRFDSIVKDIMLEIEDKGLVWEKETRNWRQGKDDDKNGYKAGQRYQFHSYMICNNYGSKLFHIDKDIVNCINTLIDYMQDEGLKLQKILTHIVNKPADNVSAYIDGDHLVAKKMNHVKFKLDRIIVDYPIYWIEVRFSEPA